MAFPTSGLTNNQVHKEGNRSFVYDSALGVWDQVPETERTELKNTAGSLGGSSTGTLGTGVTFPSGHVLQTHHCQYVNQYIMNFSHGTEDKIEAISDNLLYRFAVQFVPVSYTNYFLISFVVNCAGTSDGSQMQANYGFSVHENSSADTAYTRCKDINGVEYCLSSHSYGSGRTGTGQTKDKQWIHLGYNRDGVDLENFEGMRQAGQTALTRLANQSKTSGEVSWQVFHFNGDSGNCYMNAAQSTHESSHYGIAGISTLTVQEIQK